MTNEEGYLILPQNLSPGNYRIEEVTAPEGYTLNTSYVEIKVYSNTAYQIDPISGDAVIEVVYENHPVKGELVIRKSGEVLSGFGKDFSYEMADLAGAVFHIYAAEDIYTADHQVDEAGNRTLEYASGTLVTTVTTDTDGKAVATDLPLGKYRIEEETAPEGYVLNASSQEVEFVYAGQDTPVVSEEVTFINDRQKVQITVEKQDAENDAVLAGAEFGLYNAGDIVSGEETIVEADTLLETVTSDENGKAVFTLDLPLGQYYVKELAAPGGFVSSDEILSFDASYQGQDVPVVALESVKKNEPTTIEVTKSDITTGVELSGASLSVLDKDGNVIDSWVSVKDEPHIIKRLKEDFPGEKLPEEPSPTGEPAREKNLSLLVDLAALMEQYPDVRGWISIPDTDIDYLVLQSSADDPQYYLRRNYKGEYDINGSIFLQWDCDVRDGQNLVIYGHNMKSGVMFGTLDEYAALSYYQEHPTVLFQTLEGVYSYTVVAVLKADASMFPFQQTVFQEPDGLFQYVSQAKALQLF